jgi:hypothetical protein
MSFAFVHRQVNLNENTVKDSKTSSSTKGASIIHHNKDLTRSSYDSAIPVKRGVGEQAFQKPERSFNAERGFDFAKIGIMPKLSVSPPGDVYEQEADSVAERVIRMPVPNVIRSSSGDRTDKCGGCEMENGEELVGTKFNRKPSNADTLENIDQITDEINNIHSSGGSSLDSSTKEYMDSRFGYDFSKVVIHNDERAARSAHTIDALAYTLGNHVVFGSRWYSPNTLDGRRLLAHELTHVVQQTSSKNKDSSTLGNMPQSIQRFTAYTVADQTGGKSSGWKHPGSKGLGVSDDGQMVVEDEGWGKDRNKRAWTSSAKVAASNSTLSAQGSRIKLVTKGGTISGTSPVSSGKAITLNEIAPIKAIGVGPLNLEDDCGAACKQVMGSEGGKDVAVLKNATTESYTNPRTYHGGNPTTPEEWSEEIFKKEFGPGLTRADAYRKYDSLSASDKDKFDKKYGINKYAIPKVGRGLTVSTEKDMPGFSTLSASTWNFHYAAVILMGGNDYVTLENAAGWGPTGWGFYMYGPASKSQSFHEFHGATLTHGNKWTTLVVESEMALHASTTIDNAELEIGTGITKKLSRGTKVRIIERSTDSTGINWLDIEVEEGAFKGFRGMMKEGFTL